MTTFVRVTNQDIYEKLELLIKNNKEEHSEIIEHQVKTNGKVKTNKWIATTAISIVLIILGIFVNHLVNVIK